MSLIFSSRHGPGSSVTRHPHRRHLDYWQIPALTQIAISVSLPVMTVRTCQSPARALALKACGHKQSNDLSAATCSSALDLHEFTRRNDGNSRCVGFVRIDVHFRERIVIHAHEGPSEGKGAIVVTDANVDVLAVFNAETLCVDGVGVDVPGRDDKAVRGEASGGSLDRDLRGSLELSAIANGHLDPEREAVGARHFNLRAMAQRSEYGDTLES